MTWFDYGSVQRGRGDSTAIAAAAGVVYGLHYDVASRRACRPLDAWMKRQHTTVKLPMIST